MQSGRRFSMGRHTRAPQAGQVRHDARGGGRVLAATNASSARASAAAARVPAPLPVEDAASSIVCASCSSLPAHDCTVYVGSTTGNKK